MISPSGRAVEASAITSPVIIPDLRVCRSGRGGGGDLNMAEYGAVTPEAVTI